ncbi:RDD family protein [Leptospira sarikeiensis]|uniref:RDD family protein n=1 Tax=Leptospira sarikeiensis TaxID=2484943 RepID=A0A4R9K3N7_9LEPT|nr:RDD family protein [Leptospira sarikeiensis]TGL60666.1 RDD family protein [Leptospira sarikeiensis]
MRNIFKKINIEDQSLQYASLSRRIYAQFLDFLILCPILIPQILVFYYHDKTVYQIFPFYTALHSLLYIGYRFVMHSLYGRTFGKAFAGIIVLDSGNRPLGWVRSFIRVLPEFLLSLITILSAVNDSRIFMEHQAEMEGVPLAVVLRMQNKLNPLDNITFWDSVLYYGLSVLCILLSHKKTALHDLFAGSRVLRYKNHS